MGVLQKKKSLGQKTEKVENWNSLHKIQENWKSPPQTRKSGPYRKNKSLGQQTEKMENWKRLPQSSEKLEKSPTDVKKKLEKSPTKK